MRLSALIMIPVFAALAVAAGTECIETDGDRILAEHFARVNPVFAELPPQQPLAYAPTAGVQRVLTAVQMRRIARQHRLPDEGLSPACFERASDLLDPERILDLMQESLDNQEAEIEIVDYSRRPVPRGVVDFPLSGRHRLPLLNPYQHLHPHF